MIHTTKEEYQQLMDGILEPTLEKLRTDNKKRNEEIKTLKEKNFILFLNSIFAYSVIFIIFIRWITK